MHRLVVVAGEHTERGPHDHGRSEPAPCEGDGAEERDRAGQREESDDDRGDHRVVVVGVPLVPTVQIEKERGPQREHGDGEDDRDDDADADPGARDGERDVSLDQLAAREADEELTGPWREAVRCVVRHCGGL